MALLVTFTDVHHEASRGINLLFDFENINHVPYAGYAGNVVMEERTPANGGRWSQTVSREITSRVCECGVDFGDVSFAKPNRASCL